MKKRNLRRGVRERSQAAVAVAGTRERGSAINTHGTWSTQSRVLPDDGLPFRPGKTERERRHGRVQE